MDKLELYFLTPFFDVQEQASRPQGAYLRYFRIAALALGLATGGCSAVLSFPPACDLELLFNVADVGSAIPLEDDPVFQEQSIFKEISGKMGSHGPTVTAFEDGQLLAGWYSYEGPHELDGSAIYLARRFPGSDRWEQPILHIDRPVGEGNPVLYSEGDRVWLFQAVVPFRWGTAHIEVQQSADSGHTWSLPVAIGASIISVIRFPPVRTASGTLLLPAYDDLFSRSLFFGSHDGHQWTLQSAVFCNPPHYCIQPSVVRLSDGRLLAVMRNQGGQWLWVMVSDDDGQSWSSPIDSHFPNPASPAVLLNLRSGNLILVFNDSPVDRSRLSIAISADEGLTWPYKRILADGDSKYSYPAVIQSPDGLIHVLYSLGRLTIQHIILNESWIVSGLGN